MSRLGHGVCMPHPVSIPGHPHLQSSSDSPPPICPDTITHTSTGDVKILPPLPSGDHLSPLPWVQTTKVFTWGVRVSSETAQPPEWPPPQNGGGERRKMLYSLETYSKSSNQVTPPTQPNQIKTKIHWSLGFLFDKRAYLVMLASSPDEKPKACVSLSSTGNQEGVYGNELALFILLSDPCHVEWWHCPLP